MAEFKLGRIRFVYQGAWDSTHSYVVDDVVTVGGKTYICITTHTSSSAFETDYNANPELSNWQIIADGSLWRGNWAATTHYDLGDLVLYGGTVYICKVPHTSSTNVGPSYNGLEYNQGNWEAFAKTFYWAGTWTINTKYRVRDIVSYGGITYVCKTAHISASSTSSGLEIDQSNWDAFNEGIEYKSIWETEIRYKKNDVVTYGSDLWICISNHISTDFISDQEYWQIFVNGFQFENSWNDSSIYQIGDVVTYGGYSYVAKTNNTNKNPPTQTSDWDVYTTGINFRDAWDSGTDYKVGDAVRLGGFTYLAITDNNGQTPPSSYWTRLNSGLKWAANSQTYTSVSASNITVSNGAAAGATFTVVRANTVYTVTANNNGANYSTTDTLKILGTAVGGLSPANDIILTVTGVTGGAVNTVTNTGFSITWKSTITYVEGDVVFFGANSYYCISSHIASNGNRPDADTTGTYWNLLAAGAESAVLTTLGDTFYYGPTGPQRLPIGTDGQVLRVNNGYPAWSYYGVINDIVYVAPSGTDSLDPGWGLTIDKPWKSIRYAAQQIEDGYLNTSSKSLLQRNKQFMMKEINNYVSYTFTVSTTGTSGGAFTTASTAGLIVNMPIRFANTNGGVSTTTTYYIKAVTTNTSFTVSTIAGGTAVSVSGSGTNTGSFYYDATKTERDTGIIVDAITFDLSHGGTQKTTAAAVAYFTSASSNSFYNTTTAERAPVFSSALTYLKTLVASVLGNTAPTSNYQTLNSASPTASQIIDTSLTAESGAATTLSSLITIVTNALDSGTSTAIPAATNPYTTISIKTGTYNEILPVVVPSNTALVGDELRSTIVQPKSADLFLATVGPKNNAALTRIQGLIPDLIANTTISPTSGNTVAQVTTLPAGSIGSSSAVTRLKTSFDILYDLVASGLSDEPPIVMPSPTGYNTSSLTNTAYGTTTGTSNAAGDTTGYGAGVAQIRQNYAFLVADILQYLTNTYPAIYAAEGTAGPSRGYRDISYILDSILYDMTYGGNSQSNVSGSAYYSLYALQILSTEKQPFIDALTRLKTIITFVSRGLSVASNGGVSAGNTITQITTGSAGSLASGGFAQDRVQNVVNWITNATGDTAIAPYTGWATSALQTAYSALTAKVTEIQSDAVVWCKKYFQTVNFSTTLASRDTGLIINSLAYDMVFGSNFNAIQAGRAFNRGNTSAITLRTGTELGPTLGAINFMYFKSKQIAASGAAVQIQTTIDDINNYIAGGTAPPVITWPSPNLPSASYTSVTGTVLSGGGNGSAAFTIVRSNNGNGYTDLVITPTTAGASYTTSSKIKILGTSIGGATPANDIVLNVTQVSTGGVQAVTYSAPRDAVALLEANRAFVLAEVVAYINTNYSSITTNPNYTVSKTQRDAGFILDAVHFDLLHGGNWASQNAGMAYYSALYGNQISSPLQTATSNTVNYISTLLQSIVIGTAIGSPLQATISQVTQTTSGRTGAAKDATQAAALITIVKNFVDNGLTTGAPVITVTAIATTDTFTSNGHGLNNGDIVIPQTTTNGLSSTIIGSQTAYYVVSSATNTFKLADSYAGTALTTFTNGSGLSIKLQAIAMPSLGWVDSTSIAAYTAVSAAVSTYQSSVVTYINTNYSALTYNSSYAQRDTYNVTLASMLDMMLGSNFAAVQAGRAYNRSQDYKVLGYEKVATIASLNYLVTLIRATLSSSIYATQLSKAQTSAYLTISMLDSGSNKTPEINGTVTYNNDLGIIKGAEILRANIPFLAAETVAYYNSIYGSTVSSLAISGNLITTSAAHRLNVNDPVVFAGTSAGGITVGTTYYVASVPSTTTFTVATGEGYLNTNSGATFPTVTITSDVGSPTMTVKYYFDTAQTTSDITYFLNAIVYDLQFTGNYRSLRNSQVLLNAINGSQLSNMWLVRNGCGVRNMTMTGLTGTLTNTNSFGTKRPTAGAYTSLDPGFGPNDSNAWVTSRSTYVQNCTMFGTACTGAKIDGALHAGGNRSMVANDYTTIISDGIGVWVTGSSALTELVSVFNYYGYAGYLSELGGKIRATNGNSSYGTYGVIAEGVDTYEVPLYATLDNRANEATVLSTITDGTNSILRFEFGNTGTAYTNVVNTISGSGYNAAAGSDEYRDAAQFETRLTDNGDGTSSSVGGTNYATAINVGQGNATISGGPTGQFVIAATDTALSAGYVGMRIQITGGTAVGQYANILNYANGTKIANIYKDSFTNLTITGSTTTVLQTASTASLYINMPIYLSATTAVVFSANVVYYVSEISSATTFKLATSSGGGSVTGLTATSGQSITLYAAGWDHVVPGTAIVDQTDLTTAYIIEPRISYTAPGYTATARTLSGAGNTWVNAWYAAGKFVAVSSSATVTSQSSDGITWTSGGANTASAAWNDVVYGGGEGATGTAVVGGLGGTGAVLTAVLGTGITANQVVGVTIVSGGYNYLTPPTIVFTAVGLGSGATAICTVLNGAIDTITVTIPGSGYTTGVNVTAATDRVSSVTVNTWGKNYFTTPTVTFSTPGGISATAWTASTLVTTGAYLSQLITGTTNYYYVSSGGTTQAGAGSYPTHTSGSATNGTATLLYYGTLATATAVLTNTGVSSYTMVNNGVGYSATPTVSVLDSSAKFVAIRSGVSAASAYQTIAGLAATSSWVAGNTLQKTDLASIAYGGGLYIAVGGTSGTASAVSSTDGITWTDRSSAISALSTGTYSSIAYGNGTFVAVNNIGNKTSFATTNPASWTLGGTLPSSGLWSSVAYGNGRFVAIAAGTTLTTVVITGTAGQFSCASTGLAVGNAVTLAGTAPAGGAQGSITGYTNPTTYYIIATNGTTTFTLSATLGGTAITTTAGTPTTLTYTLASNSVAYSINKGVTWTAASAGLPTFQDWSHVEYGQGVFFAIARNSTAAATSYDGINWTARTMPGSATNWLGLAFGNPSNNPIWVAMSNTSGTTAASIRTGATPLGRMKTSSGVITEIRLVEPGSGFPKGTVTATTTSTNVITTSDTTNLVDLQPIEFTGCTTGGLVSNTTYYVIGATIVTNTSFKVASSVVNAGLGTAVSLTTTTGLTGTYRAGPTITQTDPNKVKTASVRARMGDGSVANPSFSNRGTNNTTATASCTGDGYSDLYQPSNFINLAGLYAIPTAGSNVEFASIPGTWYKLVAVTNILGIAGNYTATFQINPALTTALAPTHGDAITTKLKYSQVRLTGHDFLYIGTGNQSQTNYPYVDPTQAITGNQELFSGGGRVFFTSTDQDGNFNVGNLFGVQQATGTATLNANAFNLSGLQSLQLGAVSLGVGSAIITQFSTDPYFTANSDSIVPTQRAIKSYITAQIGGGSSSLNVNTLTAGQIYIANNTITNNTGNAINVTSRMNFTGGIDGAPVALGFFMQR